MSQVPGAAAVPPVHPRKRNNGCLKVAIGCALVFGVFALLVLGNESSRGIPIECAAMTANLANEDRVEWRLAIEPPVARADLEDYLAGLAPSLSTEIKSAEVVDGALVLEGYTEGLQDALDGLF